MLSCTVFAAVAPRPASAGEAAALFFLCLFVGLGHGGLLGLLGGALERALPDGGAARWARLALAVGIAALYSALALSLVKFATVGSHLRYEDLWFLPRSVGQLGAETTRAERTHAASSPRCCRSRCSAPRCW